MNNMSMVPLKDGNELYVTELGSGTPLVLIPGWAYTADVFDKVMPLLAESFRVIAYDPRSHGRSSLAITGNTYEQHGEDLLTLIQHMELDSFVLLGWSLGVYDAYAFCRQQGLDGVLALIAVDESPMIHKTSDNPWGEGSVDEVAGLVSTVASDQYLDFFKDYMCDGFVGDAPEELVEKFAEHASKLPPSLASGLLEDATRYDFRQLASEIAHDIPVQNILREEWSADALNWIRHNQPSAQSVVLGGHLMLLEFPDLFSEKVLSFLNASL
ncbi:MAG: alpha/beta hydrolase [Pseudomonadota bacterium]